MVMRMIQSLCEKWNGGESELEWNGLRESGRGRFRNSWQFSCSWLREWQFGFVPASFPVPRSFGGGNLGKNLLDGLAALAASLRRRGVRAAGVLDVGAAGVGEVLGHGVLLAVERGGQGGGEGVALGLGHASILTGVRGLCRKCDRDHSRSFCDLGHSWPLRWVERT